MAITRIPTSEKMNQQECSLSWSIPADVRLRCIEALRDYDGLALQRVLILHAMAWMEMNDCAHLVAGLTGTGVGFSRTKMYTEIIQFFPNCIWYNDKEDLVQMTVPAINKKECGLCFGMEWDEAIYCPQCHGSGKIEDEENQNSGYIHLAVENIIVSNEVKDGKM